ncbi:MAG TPA: ABC transporter ATP-binding protein [Nitrososphaerales archaeon]|nr:ABC transporter ATP-binding protein [Nitrososphaerales archaeon]
MSLSVEGVSSGYGKLQILSDITLAATPGQLTIVVGPNGSGKSTLLKTIAGLANMFNGIITLDGKTLSGLPAHVIARSGVAYLPQTDSTFAQLTVTENFKMAAYTVSKSDYDARIKDAFSIFPQLENYIRSKVNNLSGGERQMVAMTMALLRKPRVILFDEPTANLSPKYSTQVLKTIQALAKDRGLSIVLVEQNAKRALEVGDNAYLLVGGRNAFKGTAKELLSHQELAKLYLGVKVAGL